MEQKFKEYNIKVNKQKTEVFIILNKSPYIDIQLEFEKQNNGKWEKYESRITRTTIAFN